MSNKVICQTCLNQTNGFCSFKKTKVKLKKKRICDKFKHDLSKTKAKVEIPTTRRPDWFWDREERRKLYKAELKRRRELLEEEEAKNKIKEKPFDAVNVVATMNTGNTKYPLTGDLSRFTTTATKEKK